jgi:hypothetical protein
MQEFDEEKFLDGQAAQCLHYIEKNGKNWWHNTYKPRLLKSWGAEKLKQVTERMNKR